MSLFIMIIIWRKVLYLMVKKMTHGKSIKLIFLFMIPLLIGNIIQQLYNMTDLVIVGKFVGVNALAGVGVAGSLLFMSIGFIIGLCNGFSVVLAQRFGAGSKIGVRRCITTSIYLSLFFTAIITIFMAVFAYSFLLLINTPDEIIDSALTYILILSYGGTFALVAYNLFSGMLRAIGDSKTPLYFLIFAAILNVVLDYITITIFNLGVAGSAISTVTSQIISSILCATYMFKKYKIIRPKKTDWKINWAYVWVHIKIAFPMALEFAVTAVGIIILQGAINNLGPNIVAGFTAAMKIENLIIAAFIALASAVSTYTAQNFGAKNYQRIVSGAKSNIIIGMFLCLIFSLLLFFFWDVFVGFFINDGNFEVRAAAKQYMLIAILNYPVLCLLITFRCLVQSLGRTIAPILAGFSEVIMRSLGAFFLVGLFGYTGVCCSPILSWYAAFIIIIISYAFGLKKLKKEFNINDENLSVAENYDNVTRDFEIPHSSQIIYTDYVSKEK